MRGYFSDVWKIVFQALEPVTAEELRLSPVEGTWKSKQFRIAVLGPPH